MWKTNILDSRGAGLFRRKGAIPLGRGGTAGGGYVGGGCDSAARK